eukprot:CAMPEP_0168438048 /NCGR_PEP_ID=MMETSP0228-20121227/41759_1 /TAXON_ID=133427 /ORGANISM="Protoceratium reticulatum, Strain CCCM 535 (=CCMP 1889)" /LENGTH=52 /DNA_ID=CAMNT_0008452301 /DNA_START=220 /DNA_END=375 /DNA_ORIENTATION=+
MDVNGFPESVKQGSFHSGVAASLASGTVAKRGRPDRGPDGADADEWSTSGPQ